MGKCRHCGNKIGFSLTGLCAECLKQQRAEVQEHNYRLSVESNEEELKAFDQGRGTVVMTTNSMHKEDLLRYGQEHGYEPNSISNDGDPEFPIETIIFRKTSVTSEWECQYCKTTNGGNFCANCGSPRRK